MRPATVRRLLVFGVCALGVTALYLAPSVARAPDQILGGGRNPADQAPAATRPASLTPVSSDGGPRVEPQSLVPEPTATAAAEPDREVTAKAPRPARTTVGATAYDPDHGPDTEAPTVVTSISVTDVRRDRLTVHWAPASDDVAVTGYRVWLNGFPVADTDALSVTIAWFKDGSRQQVLQVRALDAAGHQSEQAPTALVERPAADPGPVTTPTPTPTPRPPTGTPQPDASSTGRAPDPTPSGSAGTPDGDG